MEFSKKLYTLNQDGPLYILRGHRLKFKYLKIKFVFTNSVAPGEMIHCAAFHPVFIVCQKYLFGVFRSSKG